MTIKSKFTYIIVFFCLIIFTGCSIKEASKNAPDEGDLRERVMTYWDYKVKEEFDKSYEYEDPLYRKTVTRINYIRSFNVATKIRWEGAEIEDMKIKGDTAEVTLRLKIKVAASPKRSVEQGTPLKEKWINVDGLWYHVYRTRQSSN